VKIRNFVPRMGNNFVPRMGNNFVPRMWNNFPAEGKTSKVAFRFWN